jgi:hypothetical protein
MSALALCLCTLEDELFGTLSNDEEFERRLPTLHVLAQEVPAGQFFLKQHFGAKQ